MNRLKQMWVRVRQALRLSQFWYNYLAMAGALFASIMYSRAPVDWAAGASWAIVALLWMYNAYSEKRLRITTEELLDSYRDLATNAIDTMKKRMAEEQAKVAPFRRIDIH